jgi:hypothetical protein
MPSRWLSLVIVAFWMCTTGWLFWHEVWPLWRPGEPPPYTIDLTAEAHRSRPRIAWTVSQNRRNVFLVETWVDSPEPDLYELHAMAIPARGLDPTIAVASLGPLKVDHWDSTLTVDSDGRLRALKGHVHGTLGNLKVTADLEGEVRQEHFLSSIRGRCPEWYLDKTIELKAVPVSQHGSMLLPLHPVNRIQGLRPGQTWRLPVVSPLAAALAATAGLADDGTRVLQAEVLPQTQPLPWHERDVPCLVIRYRGEEMTAATWVEEETGQVLRQEADQGDDHWVMQRD